MTHTSSIVLLLALLSAPEGKPTGEETLQKVVERFSAIHDYTVTLGVIADIERLNVPPMHVTIYFKQPDRFHFDSDGFVMLPRDGMALNPTRFLSKFSIVASSEDTANNTTCTKLTLQPTAEKEKLRIVFLYVEPHRFTIEKIVSPLFDGRTMTALFLHQRHAGHWVPSQVTVTFASEESDTTESLTFEQPAPVQAPRAPRTGTITIRYSNYKINTGLSDEIFEKNDQQAKE